MIFIYFSFAEDYTEEHAVAHIRRLLDIVACTTCFGSSGKQGEPRSGQGGGKESAHSMTENVAEQNNDVALKKSYLAIKKEKKQTRMEKTINQRPFKKLKVRLRLVKKKMMERRTQTNILLRVKEETNPRKRGNLRPWQLWLLPKRPQIKGI